MKRSTRIMTLVLATLLFAACFIAIPASAAGSASFSAMTYNLKNSNYGFSDVQNLMKAQRPAVLGMQEVTNLQWSSVNSKMKDLGYASVRGNYRGTTKITEGNECNPIFYMTSVFTLQNSGSFWLSDTPTKQSKYSESGYYRIATWAVLKAKSTGDCIIVVNTHLDLNATARFKQEQVLLKQLVAIEKNAPAAKDNLIIMGDLNSGSNTAIFKYITGAAKYNNTSNNITWTRLQSSRLAASSVTNNKWGNYYSNPSTNPTADLDHIIISTHCVTCTKYIVVNDAAGSDHLPIRVTLKLKTA